MVSPNVAYQFWFKSLPFWHYSRIPAASPLSYVFAKLNSDLNLLTNRNGFNTFRAPFGVLSFCGVEQGDGLGRPSRSQIPVDD